ncbi:DDB1- and CUL4-associated factor 5 isoform X2 [Nylanderia fulva]|uniref:DDB1- and CUL4-associated factor 5 isoform X2 n=1 Tax=Nylanderia fulva TaxID=613905 RepID=UPI0010FBB1DC|nr:DDB1- and CUL4-associated factor 5 isoform X2 [Nylanderia fulva]
MPTISKLLGGRKGQDRPRPAVEEDEDGRVKYRAASLRRRRRRLRQSCEGGSDRVGRGKSGGRSKGSKSREKTSGKSQEQEMTAHHPSESSVLSYVFARQIDNRFDYCRRLVSARFEKSENLYRKDLLSHYGCVNAIEFSNQGDLLVSGGDDRRVLLWKVEQAIQDIGKPTVMKGQHVSNIFCLGYDSSKTKIFSAGNDDQVIVHDLRTSDALNFFLHEKPVYGLSIHPHNDDIFASACDDGRVLIYDIRTSTTETSCLAQYKSAFHSVMFNPVDARMLATANAKEGVSMWDVRKPLEPVLCYGSPQQSCMNVRFNSVGNRLLALRRRLPPVLYAVDSPTYLCEFDHAGYYNSCTMKSCCFAGENDEYVLSGSDDFNLYMWKIPPMDGKPWVESAHMVLRGHRSIVNQVRYNQASCIFASSGVEKIIKIWSPFPLGKECLGGLKRDAGKRERQRRVFTHDEYIGLVLRSGQFMTHDYSHQSTKEDPRMMAFFDSLVQREIEGWSSEDVPTPHTPSDPEIDPATGEPYSATDFDDTTGSEGGVAPDRPSESPNRITRLIANRREKMMRMARHLERSASDSGSEDNNDHARRSKMKSKSKDVKRTTHAKLSADRRRISARRKCTVLKVNSDSESEDDGPVDAAQPSTSSGVISRRSRYVANALEKDDKQRSSYSSSSNNCNNSNNSDTSSSGSNNGSNSGSNSSSEENNVLGTKRKHSKSDSDASTAKVQRRKHRKCKNNAATRHENCSGKSQSKRQKLEDESDKKRTGATDSDWFKNCVNGNADKDGPSTPNSKSLQVHCTFDSFKSGISSTGDRSGLCSSERTRNKGGNDDVADDTSFDREQKLKRFESIRKQVEELARRRFGNRSLQQKQKQLSQTLSTSDSSD